MITFPLLGTSCSSPFLSYPTHHFHLENYLPLAIGWQTKRSENRTRRTIASGEGIPRARTKYTASVLTIALRRSSLSRLTDSDNTNLRKQDPLSYLSFQKVISGLKSLSKFLGFEGGDKYRIERHLILKQLQLTSYRTSQFTTLEQINFQT